MSRAVLAGGGAWVLSALLPPQLGFAAWALILTLAMVPPTSWMGAATAVLWSVAAGAAALSLGGAGAAVGGALVGASLGRQLGGTRRWSAAAVGAVGGLTAPLVSKAFAITGALAFLPAGLELLVAGAAGGFVLGVSSLGRHLELAPPTPQLAGTKDELADLGGEGELGQLLTRAKGAYRDALSALGDDAPAARTAATDLIRRIAKFGRMWRDLEAEGARVRPDELQQRMAFVTRRLEAATDPLVRTELERTREALAAQVECLDEITRGRERALARLTHQVATLERLRLTALRHRSADAGRLGAELQPMVDDLAQAGSDLEIESQALNEMAALPTPEPEPKLALVEPAADQQPAAGQQKPNSGAA